MVVILLCILSIVCGVLTFGLYHLDKIHKELQLKIDNIDVHVLKEKIAQDVYTILRLEKQLATTTEKLSSLEDELLFYRKLPISSKDMQLLQKLVSHVKTSVNSKLTDEQIFRNVLACLVASRISDVPFSHVLALVHTESTFRSTAISSMNCRGLTQVSRRIWNVYSTALQLGMYSIENPFANSMVGTSYLKALHRSYSGNYHRALQHYNGGTRFSGATHQFANVVIARASMWNRVIQN